MFTTVRLAVPLEGADSALLFPVLMTPLMEIEAISGETAFTAMWRLELWSRHQQQSWLLVLTTLSFAERFIRYLMDCEVYRFRNPQTRSPLIQLLNLQKQFHAS